LINKGLPIFQLARLRVNDLNKPSHNESLINAEDLAAAGVGSPIITEKAPKLVVRDPGDLMFQTEIDPELPEEEEEDP
jgi:hypothetical protein